MNSPRSSFRTSFTAALFPFLLTRVLILAVLLCASALGFDEPVQDFGVRIQEPVVSFTGIGFTENLRRKLANGDAGWYIGIAAHGYERNAFDASREHNWAFFPLFPLLLGFVGKVTSEYALTGSLLTSLLFLLALVQLHRLVLEFGFDLEGANRTVFYLAAFPTSYFFSLPFTESLFLLLSVSCFLSAMRGNWWLAGLCGALAASTRVTGLCLFPALLPLYWKQYRSLKPNAIALLMIPLGIVPYMIFLHTITGNAKAFMDVQVAWGHSPGFFLQPLWDYLRRPLELSFRWDFRVLNFLAGLLGMTCGVVLLKRRQWSAATYTLLCVILPLSAMQLQSLARYTMISFPIFILLAEVGRYSRVDQIIRVVFVFGLGVLTLLFALHFSMAMS